MRVIGINDDTKRCNQNSVFPRFLKACCSMLQNIALFIGKKKSSILAQPSVFVGPSPPTPSIHGSTEA